MDIPFPREQSGKPAAGVLQYVRVREVVRGSEQWIDGKFDLAPVLGIDKKDGRPIPGEYRHHEGRWLIAHSEHSTRGARVRAWGVAGTAMELVVRTARGKERQSGERKLTGRKQRRQGGCRGNAGSFNGAAGSMG